MTDGQLGPSRSRRGGCGGRCRGAIPTPFTRTLHRGYFEPADRVPNCPLVEVDRKRRTRDQTALLPSRPEEFHPEPLTDPDVTLSRPPARAIA
jgi:hypothetical protein